MTVRLLRVYVQAEGQPHVGVFKHVHVAILRDNVSF